MTFPFPTDPALLAVTQGYVMQELIADRIMPRVATPKKEFKYLKLTTSQRLTLPETQVGRKSRPTEVDFSAAEKTASCFDYALDSGVPQDDIDNAYSNYHPLNNAVAGLTELIMLDREKRVAQMMSDGSNFAKSETFTKASDKFSSVDSDPVTKINAALDSTLHRPNTMVLSAGAWTALKNHPHVVKATHRNSGDVGNASRQAVAELFELKEVLVGSAYINTAHRGQTAQYGRVWGSHLALIYLNPNARLDSASSFAITAQYRERLAGAQADQHIGMRGGQRVRVGESVVELIIDPQAGYLFKDVA